MPRSHVIKMPTGYGKPIMYQLLLWIFDVLNDPFVVSPLQSLMEDQSNRMKEIGISQLLCCMKILRRNLLYWSSI